MTPKELIPKLIEHYKFGIENLPKNNFEDFLYINCLSLGVCNCAQEYFGVDIYDSQWMKNLTNEKGVICAYPSDTNRDNCLVSLKIRLKALESIDLNTLKDE